MNENPLKENVEELKGAIINFRSESDKWWRYNHGRNVLLLILSAFASAGATIAGIWGCAHMSATLAASGGAIIALQNGLRYSEKAQFYGRSLAECDRLLDKLKFQTNTATDFDGILGAYHQLRNQEDQGPGKKKKT